MRFNNYHFIPFSDYSFEEIIFRRETDVQIRVSQFTDDEILANDENILADNLYEEFRFIPVEIQEEETHKRKMTQTSIKVNDRLDVFLSVPEKTVDGISIEIFIPFIGDDVLFHCKASTYSFSQYPEISIANGYISLYSEFRISKGNERAIVSELRNRRDEAVQRLRTGISFANKDFNEFNSRLRTKALSLIKAKKEKVSSLSTLYNLLEIPTKQTDFAKSHIQIKRNIQPITHVYNQEPTYYISDKDYKDILFSLKHIGATIEQTPASYKCMGEEDLRNVFLAHLNILYQGRATGETFRKSGKTDICIEMENRAAFIAECKMWSGPKNIADAINQLDSYLTWRDCKTALVFFVRRVNYITIIKNAQEALRALPHMREVDKNDENEFDCFYNSKVTPGQIIRIRCFLFNIEPGTSKR